MAAGPGQATGSQGGVEAVMKINSMYVAARKDDGLNVAWLKGIADEPAPVAGAMPTEVVRVLRNDGILVRVATKAGRAIWGQGKNYQRLVGLLK